MLIHKLNLFIFSLIFIAHISAFDMSHPLNILIVGSGGREHALTYKVTQSPYAGHIFVAPGNGGTKIMDNVHNIPITDNDHLVQFVQQHAIDLVLVGPEAPLAEGMVDRFDAMGIPCFGPTQAAAQLESSKRFAKDFMQQHGIPTAAYQTVTTIEKAEQYIKNHSLPIVLKADGLAAGKGVIIAHTKQEALDTARWMLSGEAFGQSGKQIVLEEFLEGEEVSFIVITDGTHALPLVTTQDYKKRDNGNKGLNTGGMGCHSPAPCITPQLHERIMQEIIEPTLYHMKQNGTPFKGFLYAGLMITPEGDPKVLEFNCRLGDPEAQPILLRMKSDLIPLCFAAIEEKLNTLNIEWDSRKAVTVIIADGDYPEGKQLGQPIIIDKQPDATIFHAGTIWKNNQLVTNGGRILGITALGNLFKEAREKTYAQVEKIHIPHMHYRTDIAMNL